MKTRYFVSDRDCKNGDELFLTQGEYRHIDGSFCCVQGSAYELNYITKVEEMELSDFIADGRTKYELNGIRFVVISKESVSDDCITVRTDSPCTYKDLCADEIAVKSIDKLNLSIFEIASRTHKDASSFHSHIDDIKLVYTSNQYVEAIEKEVPELKDVRNKYDVQIVGKDGVKTTVDVYRVLNAFDVHDAATQHAIKKLLAAGKRGHKDCVQDLKEAIASIELAILEWEQENEY